VREVEKSICISLFLSLLVIPSSTDCSTLSTMSSLLEEAYDPPLSSGSTSNAGTAQPPPPIQSYLLLRSVQGTPTELLVQTFDDRIFVVVTQNGKVGCLVSTAWVGLW